MLNRFLIIGAQLQLNCFDHIIRLMCINLKQDYLCNRAENGRLCSIITELNVLDGEGSGKDAL